MKGNVAEGARNRKSSNYRLAIGIAIIVSTAVTVVLLVTFFAVGRKPASDGKITRSAAVPGEVSDATPSLAGGNLLTDVEQDYITQLGPIYFCCDPDWEPYERVDAEGNYVGIAADLVRLISERSGVELRLLPTGDWTASLEASRRGECLVLAFLNRTPERERWLVFTDPYFEDPSVIIAREDTEFIADLSRIDSATVALPRGTSIEERIRRDYPRLEVILTDSERSAMDLVSNRRADLTLRSLAVAAYTIRKEGYFNLKIAGQLADYTNSFRMGVSKDYPLLRDILDRGVRTITPQDVQHAINNHIPIINTTGLDVRLVRRLTMAVVGLSLAAWLWFEYLRRYNSHLRLIIDTMPAYVFAKDSRGRYILANNSTAAFFDLEPKDMLGKTDADLQGDSDQIHEYEAQDREVMESRQPLFIAKHPGRRFDKSPGWFQTTKVPYRRPGTKKMALLGVTVDITDLKNAETRLEESEQRYRHLAQHDQLTGLPNRALFFDRLEQALALSRREHSGLALLFIDLDKFKEVNDSMGHDAGDQVLRESSSRMQSCIRESDSAGRIGGDEFVVLLQGIEDIHAALLGAEKLRAALDEPFMISGREARISASIGIALFPSHASGSSDLAQHADAAMYRSKANGRNQVCVYDPALDSLPS